MTATIKYIVFFSFCFLFLFAIAHPEAAWSAPKGKLVVSQGGDPSTIDPNMHSEIFVAAVLNNVYDFLAKRTF